MVAIPVRSMASSWVENPTDKDGLLRKHQLSPLIPLCNLTTAACGRWSLTADKVKRLGVHFEQLISWHNA